MARPLAGDKKKGVTILFAVDSDMLCKITAGCKKENRSKSDFCRNALACYLDKQNGNAMDVAPVNLFEKFIAANVNAKTEFGKAIIKATKGKV